MSEFVESFVAQHFPTATRRGDQWKARCPVPGHGRGRGDLRPSLGIGIGRDGRVLMRCFCGCTTDDICAALGVEPPALFVPRRIPR